MLNPIRCSWDKKYTVACCAKWTTYVFSVALQGYPGATLSLIHYKKVLHSAFQRQRVSPCIWVSFVFLFLWNLWILVEISLFAIPVKWASRDKTLKFCKVKLNYRKGNSLTQMQVHLFPVSVSWLAVTIPSARDLARVVTNVLICFICTSHTSVYFVLIPLYFWCAQPVNKKI